MKDVLVSCYSAYPSSSHKKLLFKLVCIEMINLTLEKWFQIGFSWEAGLKFIYCIWCKVMYYKMSLLLKKWIELNRKTHLKKYTSKGAMRPEQSYV